MRAKLRTVGRVLNHPVLSAVNNVAGTISVAIFVGVIASAVVGRVLDQPTLFLIAIGLAVLGLSLVAGQRLLRWKRPGQVSTIPAIQEGIPAPSPVAPTAAPVNHTFKSLQIIQEMFDEAERRKRDLVVAEFATMVDEGTALMGDPFAGKFPTSDEFAAWEKPLIRFVEDVLGPIEKQRLLEVKPTAPNAAGKIDGILGWLRHRRDDPALWESQLGGIDGSDLEAAIATRRNVEQEESLADALTALMQEGIKLVTELSASVEPERTEGGGVQVSGGDAPKEWQDKADAFRQKAWNLLAERDPALLKVYEEACNAEIQKSREAGNGAPERTKTTDKRSGLEMAVDLANWQRGGPKWEVEITLDGLSAAKLRLDELSS